MLILIHIFTNFLSFLATAYTVWDPVLQICMRLIFLTRIGFVAIAFCNLHRMRFATYTTYNTMHLLWDEAWCTVRTGH